MTQKFTKTRAYAAALCLLTFMVSFATGNVIGAALVPVVFY